MVRKPEGRDILYHFLSQVMIDMIDLPLLEPLGQVPVQLLGRFKIGPERFLHDDPVMRIHRTQFAFTKRIGDQLDEPRRHRKIEHPDPTRWVPLLELVDLSPQRGISDILLEISLDIDDPLTKDRPFGRIGLPAPAEFIDPLQQLIPVRLLFDIDKVNTKDSEIGGQMPVRIQIIQRWYQLSAGQIAPRAEYSDHRRFRPFALAHMIVLDLQTYSIALSKHYSTDHCQDTACQDQPSPA